MNALKCKCDYRKENGEWKKTKMVGNRAIHDKDTTAKHLGHLAINIYCHYKTIRHMNWGCKILDEGVQMHTLLFFAEALSRATLRRYSLNDRQGGARGCIVKRV